MARQGSLRQRITDHRCQRSAAVRCCALVLWVGTVATIGSLLAATASAAGFQELPELDVRVVFAFQSPNPQAWNFRLRLADDSSREARFGEIRNLSEAATSAGMFHLDPNERTLAIRSRHAITGGKFELRIRSGREAKLLIEPIDEQEAEGRLPAAELAVVDLSRSQAIRSHESPSDQEAATSWTIQRLEGDVLRLENLAPVPIHRAGDPLKLSIRTNGMIDHASKAYVISYQLYRVSDGEVVNTHRWPVQIDAFGNSPAIAVDDVLPEVAGVYEIRVEIDPDDSNLWSRLRRRSPPVVRVTRPIAVLHSTLPSGTEGESWREIGVIRPSESSWSVGQWLPKPTTRLIPGAAAIEATQTLESQTHAERAVSVLPPLETFQATLPVKTAGYPHQVTLRLPSNVSADLQVQVGKQRDQARVTFVLERDSTADHQGPWREHTFIHYPVNDDQIWLTNLDPSNNASFESIAVHAGPLQLASEPSGQDAEGRAAILRLSDIGWTETLTADLFSIARLDGCAPSTIELNRLWVAAERLRDYTRAFGFNGLLLPAGDGARTWYRSSLYAPQNDIAIPRQHHLETLLKLLESSQLRVYVELNPNMLLTDLERRIHEQESQLIELTRGQNRGEPTQSDPSSAASARARTQYNPLHPVVQTAMVELVRELHERCRPIGGFAGIVVDCEGTSHLQPPQDALLDAGSLLLFARASKLSTNVTQLRNSIQQEGREAFDLWRQRSLRAGYQQVSRAAEPNQVQLLFPVSAQLDAWATHSQTSPKRIAAETAPTPPPSLPVIHCFRYGPAGVLAKRFAMQQQLASTTHPLAATLLGEERKPASPPIIRETMIGNLCRMIDRTDPTLLMIDGSMILHHDHNLLARILRSFCALPAESMRDSVPLDSASHTVHLRWTSIDGQLYVSLIGVVPWTSDVDLEMTNPTQWEVLGRPEVETSQLVPTNSGTRSRVTIPSGQMVVLRSRETSGNTIRSWTTRVHGGPEVVDAIKLKVTQIVERIGILADFKPYEILTNGGFEQSGEMGLVGWLHAQHPPGCVQIDDKEFTQGTHSLLLTTSTPEVARTWLVSETFEPPASGRLAVSLAYRAEASSEETPHLLRVSIEGTRQGDPVRFTRDLEVTRNGQWSPRSVILEVDELDSNSMESLRLTIDSLSGGRLWIDDVQLHDRFPTAKERADLENQAFLAVQGLQRGNLLPSGRLLRNHWARHLLTLAPTEQARRVIEAVPVTTETPGVAERIRNWLPVPLRF